MTNKVIGTMGVMVLGATAIGLTCLTTHMTNKKHSEENQNITNKIKKFMKDHDERTKENAIDVDYNENLVTTENESK